MFWLESRTGRRELAQRQIGVIAKAEGWNELVQHCRQAVAHEQKFRGAIYRIASEAVNAIERGELVDLAKDMVERLFPGGAAGITRLAYPEQAVEVQALIDALQGPFKDTTTRLGLAPYVKQAAVLNREFSSLLLERLGAARPQISFGLSMLRVKSCSARRS